MASSLVPLVLAILAVCLAQSPLRTYGSFGASNTSATQLKNPNSVALGLSGVFVSDFGNRRVLFFSDNNTTASQVFGASNFSSVGTFFGLSLNSVCYGPASNMIQLFASEGVTSFPAFSSFNGTAFPTASASYASSKSYVCKVYNNDVIYATTKGIVSLFGSVNISSYVLGNGTTVALTNPISLEIDSNGRVYVGDGSAPGQVLVLASLQNNTLLYSIAAGVSVPLSLSFGPNNMRFLHVLSAAGPPAVVDVYDTQNNWTQIGTLSLSTVAGTAIAVDSTLGLYVACSSQHVVNYYAPIPLLTTTTTEAAATTTPATNFCPANLGTSCVCTTNGVCTVLTNYVAPPGTTLVVPPGSTLVFGQNATLPAGTTIVVQAGQTVPISVNGTVVVGGSVTVQVGPGSPNQVTLVNAVAVSGNFSSVTASSTDACTVASVSNVNYAPTSITVTLQIGNSCGSSLPLGAIIGIAVGCGVVAVGLVLLMVLLVLRKKKRDDQKINKGLRDSELGSLGSHQSAVSL